MFEVPNLGACMVGRHQHCMNKWFVHLGVGSAWWSIGNHGQIVFWPDHNIHIVLLCKLAIYCDYIWYILHTADFYVLGLGYPCFRCCPLYFSACRTNVMSTLRRLKHVMCYKKLAFSLKWLGPSAGEISQLNMIAHISKNIWIQDNGWYFQNTHWGDLSLFCTLNRIKFQKHLGFVSYRK